MLSNNIFILKQVVKLLYESPIFFILVMLGGNTKSGVGGGEVGELSFEVAVCWLLSGEAVSVQENSRNCFL